MKAGKVRPLALFGAKRSKALPDVPTLKELGYDIEYYLWVGIFAPAHTPDAAIAKLRTAIEKAAHTPGYEQALGNLGIELAYLDAPEFAKFWNNDAERVESAVAAIGRVQG
jgi:tripartite-type tricarboxylate transporter receptor subunit TctC